MSLLGHSIQLAVTGLHTWVKASGDGKNQGSVPPPGLYDGKSSNSLDFHYTWQAVLASCHFYVRNPVPRQGPGELNRPPGPMLEPER